MINPDIILYGIANCDTVKKARAWLSARSVQYQFHDFKKHGVPAERLAQSQTPAVATACQAHTQAAIAGGVFGAPSYVLDGEIFWGQDRLDFLQHQLGAK